MLLISSIATSIPLIQNASAHTPPWTIPTYSFLNVSPDPIGVGQAAFVNFWIDKVPPTAEGQWGYKWHDMTVTVTKPDGTTETLGPFSSDAAGGTWTTYTPTMEGNYTFVGHFPTQIITNENPYPYSNASLGTIHPQYQYINDTYTASTSNTMTLNVQQTPVPTTAYPQNPIPTSYWVCPINSMNREWSSIGGNWLGSFEVNGTGNFRPYTQGPETAHVLWTKPMAFGGQIGGEFGSSETGLYATGTAYEAKFGNPVVINGVLYYTEYPGAMNNPGPLTAVDLRTGQTLWTENTTGQLNIGQIQQFITGNQYGAHAYLWTAPVGSQGWVLNPAALNPATNVWSMYDAMTGQWILNIAYPSPGTLAEGPNGEILSYSTSNGLLTMWNSSLCIQKGSQANNLYAIYSASEIWRPPQGATFNWSLGNQWSVPIPTTVSGLSIFPGLSVASIDNNVAILTSPTFAQAAVIPDVGTPGGGGLGYRIDAGVNAATGQLLWGPVNRTLTSYTTQNIVAAGDGVYVDFNAQTMTWTGYSTTTGAKLWGPTTPYNSTWGYYDLQGKGIIGYGNLYTWSLNGEVYCYNLTTGAKEWGWTAGSAGFDTPYGVWPFWSNAAVLGDGTLYLASSHDYTPPVYKGARMYALNASTGQEIWDTLDFGGTQGNTKVLSDGILLSDNSYDNQIYAWGTGPSKTTVAAPNVGVTTATPVTITGSVTDVSAGSQMNGVIANFPNGLPCVSDDSMSQFMEAVYQQQPMPHNVTGVPVTLSVLDSNGNYRNIGTTTSDGTGAYGLTWTPDIPGNYTVIATFAGSGSYYGSTAQTYMYASSATTPAPTATTANNFATTSDLMLGITVIAVIVIIIGAILAVLTLRKRP